MSDEPTQTSRLGLISLKVWMTQLPKPERDRLLLLISMDGHQRANEVLVKLFLRDMLHAILLEDDQKDGADEHKPKNSSL
jgi:hypothetical protein